MNPNGPLRHKKIDTNSPTTTGGSPIPVLIKATVVLRPGNLMSASAIPNGTPSKSEMKVALPEILSDSQVISQISASRPKTSSTALTIPCQISSNLHSELFFFFSGDGHEQRLAEFVHAEIFDHVLRLRRDHEIGNGRAAGCGNPRAVGRVHLYDRIDI